MSVPEPRLQELLANKDADQAAEWCSKYKYVEGWRIQDGCLIIYNVDHPPEWMPKMDWEEGTMTVPAKAREVGPPSPTGTDAAKA